MYVFPAKESLGKITISKFPVIIFHVKFVNFKLTLASKLLICTQIRKAHFGLSSLCENCSERQLKIKKQQQQSSKRPAFCSVTLETGLQKYLSNDEGHPYAVMLNNALFLLQMINTVPEGHLSQTYEHACGIVPIKTSFNCLSALGVTESQIMNDEDVLPDIKIADVRLRRSGDGKLSKEKRSASTMSTAFEDGPWEGHLRRRKTSNGDQILGM